MRLLEKVTLFGADKGARHFSFFRFWTDALAHSLIQHGEGDAGPCLTIARDCIKSEIDKISLDTFFNFRLIASKFVSMSRLSVIDRVYGS